MAGKRTLNAKNLQSLGAAALAVEQQVHLLLRAMVVFALSMGRSKRYRDAAEHLRQCERLDARIDDWQGVEPHSSFAGRLRESFGQKWSFWQLLER
jgi:hypothetical protein